MAVVNRWGDAISDQHFGAGQTRRSCTDYCHPFAGRSFAAVFRAPPHLQSGINNIYFSLLPKLLIRFPRKIWEVSHFFFPFFPAKYGRCPAFSPLFPFFRCKLPGVSSTALYTSSHSKIPSAANLPSAMAVTTRSEPRTASPPANTLGIEV
jgi:hypothetical protein